MFAPAPRSHFIPRTYTAHHPTQTTVKRANATNKENALPTKTPSRAGPSNGPLKAVNTGMRAGLGGKTVDRDRNVLKAPQEHMDIGPKRLFQSTSKTASSLKPSKSLTFSQPLQHSAKTPGPKQRAPPTAQRPALRTPAPVRAPVEPSPAPLPSATRTRRRSRLSVTPAKQADTSYHTPARSKQWEEGDSLGSITDHLEHLQIGPGTELEGVVEEAEAELEEDNELEYMPPKVEPLPWSPPFEMPDMTGKWEALVSIPGIWGLGGGATVVWPELETHFEDVEVRLCEDAELEEPEMLRLMRPPSPPETIKEVAPKPAAPRPGLTKPSIRPAPGTSRLGVVPRPRPLTVAPSRPKAVTFRPAGAPSFSKLGLPPKAIRPAPSAPPVSKPRVVLDDPIMSIPLNFEAEEFILDLSYGEDVVSSTVSPALL